MKIVTVYHKTEPNFMFRTADMKNLKLSEFTAVAYVTLPSGPVMGQLEDTFRLTNHIDQPWWDNAGVECLAVRTQRSTSVGDLLKIENQYFMVAHVSFVGVDVKEGE